MKTETTTKKSVTEIEEIIEKTLAELNEIYELDTDDINGIREETYKANGWSYDPFPEETEEAEAEDEGIEYDEWGDPIYTAWTLESALREVGMSMRDFF